MFQMVLVLLEWSFFPKARNASHKFLVLNRLGDARTARVAYPLPFIGYYSGNIRLNLPAICNEPEPSGHVGGVSV